MDERFADVGRGITLCYETFGDPADPPVLLVMGLATQMLGWHEDLCAQLARREFFVVRFDNRDCGRSTHITDLRPPTLAQMATRRLHHGQYRLADMADDAAGLLAALDLGPAHVVGASMGGMIAQELALRHPDRVASLVSVMSTTGARTKGQPALPMYRHLLKPPGAGRDAAVERTVRVFAAIGSPGFPRDLDDVRERAGMAYDRGHDRAAPGRQIGAILASGDRTAALRGLRVPTLVVHGAADRLVRPSGGRATARAIPGAELELIDGMGHDLPRELWGRLQDGIERTARRAGADADVATAA